MSPAVPTNPAATVSATGPAWTDPLLANPHAVPDKAARVNSMFSAIAPSYDLNNRLHSLWMDQHWRSVAVKMAEVRPGDAIVDVACGTGDLTLKFARKNVSGRTVGLDFTHAMLPLAREKARRQIERLKLRVDHPPAFLQADALALPLPDASADVLSIAFGIRNVANWQDAISEFARVLKPGGRLIILEFSLPRNAVLRGFYNFYFRKIMPRTATLISGDKSGAYKYLPESVNTFISPAAMIGELKTAGFTAIRAKALTLGICTCYRAVKP